MNQIPNIEETDTREIEEVINLLLQRLDATIVTDVMGEIVSSYLNHKVAGNILAETFHQQLQQARESWLREVLHTVDRINISTEIEFVQQKDQFGYYRCQEDVKKFIQSERNKIRNNNMNEYNIIDGEKCCWRCGASQKDVKEGKAGGCSGWGTYYGNHMYIATKMATLDPLPDQSLNQERE